MSETPSGDDRSAIPTVVFRAVVVAAESPLGQASEAVEAAARHLPLSGHTTCNWCRAPAPWPCPPFVQASRAAASMGVRIDQFTPTQLHGLLPRELVGGQPPAVSALTDATAVLDMTPLRPKPPPRPERPGP